MNNREVLFLTKLQQAITLLNDIDDIIESNPQLQQNVDWEISDYLHLIENENDKLSQSAKVDINNKLERCRLLRRDLLHINALSKTYNDYRTRLVFRKTRQEVADAIQSTLSGLDNEYKYRVLDDKTIEDFYNMKDDISFVENKDGNIEVVKKRTRKRGQFCISKEELVEAVNKGMRGVDIAKMFGVTPTHISHLKRTYGLEVRKKRS